MFRYAVGAAALTLVVAFAEPAAAQRVRAGVLTCDISAGMSFIVGSQKSVGCMFAPEPPGPEQVYSGSISKFGLDIGATGGGVMVWAVFTDSLAPPGAGLAPFAQHFWVCMVADRYAVLNRHLIGLDKLMWECDFPHNDSNWPDSRKVLADAVHDIPDDEARQIGELNARRLYDFW